MNKEKVFGIIGTGLICTGGIGAVGGAGYLANDIANADNRREEINLLTNRLYSGFDHEAYLKDQGIIVEFANLSDKIREKEIEDAGINRPLATPEPVLIANKYVLEQAKGEREYESMEKSEISYPIRRESAYVLSMGAIALAGLAIRRKFTNHRR